jgi:hypothetical protein
MFLSRKKSYSGDFFFFFDSGEFECLYPCYVICLKLTCASFGFYQTIHLSGKISRITNSADHDQAVRVNMGIFSSRLQVKGYRCRCTKLGHYIVFVFNGPCASVLMRSMFKLTHYTAYINKHSAKMQFSLTFTIVLHA